VHLIGFSLGGLVVLHMLELNRALPKEQQVSINRIVLLATPANGSDVAQRICKKHWLRPILGKSVKKGLLGGAPVQDFGCEIGVLSGSRPFGLAATLFPLKGVNDGVVTEAETRINVAVDTDCVPQSHTLMLFSRVCAEKVAVFLRTGRFESDRQSNART